MFHSTSKCRIQLSNLVRVSVVYIPAQLYEGRTNIIFAFNKDKFKVFVKSLFLVNLHFFVIRCF